jgi:hypothetical protein
LATVGSNPTLSATSPLLIIRQVVLKGSVP